MNDLAQEGEIAFEVIDACFDSMLEENVSLRARQKICEYRVHVRDLMSNFCQKVDSRGGRFEHAR